MSNRLSQPWIPLSKIQELVQLEPALLLLSLSLGAWIIYKIFLRTVSEQRHSNIQKLFRNLYGHLAFGTAFFIIYMTLEYFGSDTLPTERVQSYVGLLVLISGVTIFIKLAKILVFEYLFLSHMKVAVPLLLVNLFTLIFSIVLAGWMATEIFNIRIVSVLATSAIFSLVLGLALQDTLGNLFAGVALQFDKPYEIGDWVEVSSNNQKWVGRVHEISWRATVLVAMTDETITLPNRVMSQAEISNYSTKHRPIVRAQLFRIPYSAPQEDVKKILLSAVLNLQEVKKFPEPLVLMTEMAESWILFKVLYSIDNYGFQLLIGDQVLSACLKALRDAGIETASPRVFATLRHAIPMQDQT